MNTKLEAEVFLYDIKQKLYNVADTLNQMSEHVQLNVKQKSVNITENSKADISTHVMEHQTGCFKCCKEKENTGTMTLYIEYKTGIELRWEEYQTEFRTRFSE